MHGQLPLAAPEQNTDQERYHDCMQGRFLSPPSQAIKGRTWSPIPFDSASDGPSGFLDRLSSRLNGLLSLVELVWAIDTFADHPSSPRQCGKSTPGTHNRSRPLDHLATNRRPDPFFHRARANLTDTARSPYLLDPPANWFVRQPRLPGLRLAVQTHEPRMKGKLRAS